MSHCSSEERRNQDFFLFVWEGGGALEILKEERLFCFALFYRYITGKVLFRDYVELLTMSKMAVSHGLYSPGNEQSSIFIIHKNRQALPRPATSPRLSAARRSRHPAPEQAPSAGTDPPAHPVHASSCAWL